MKIKFYLLFYFLIPVLFVKANSSDSLVLRVFQLSYNQEYALANSILTANKSSIDAVYFSVLDIDMSYWKNVTGTTNPVYDEFETTLEKYDDTSPLTIEEKVVELVQLSYKLRYELKRYKFFKAISTQKQTKMVFNELKTNNETQKFELQELIQLYNAMFNYFENYLNPFAKKEISSNALVTMEKLATSDNNIVKTLASYFIGKTYLKYEKEPEKGIQYFEYLCTQYPGNIMFPQFLNDCEKQSK